MFRVTSQIWLPQLSGCTELFLFRKVIKAQQKVCWVERIFEFYYGEELNCEYQLGCVTQHSVPSWLAKMQTLANEMAKVEV